MDKISISEEFVNDIVDALNKLNSKTKNAIHIHQAELNDKCKELEKQEDDLTEFLLKGTIDSAFSASSILLIFVVTIDARTFTFDSSSGYQV